MKPHSHTHAHTPTHTHTRARAHTHTHTHTHTHIFTQECVYENNKLRRILLWPLHHLSINLSPKYANNFLPTPLNKIRQNDYLLKVLKVKDSYSASEGGGLDFQTMPRPKFMCPVYMQCGNISTYALKL